MKKNDLKRKSGITLVALVITIIILLILAGISIAQLIGSGLFENAKLAKEKSENAQEQEDELLVDYQNKINQYVDGNREQITISKEDLNKLIDSRIDENEKINNLYSQLNSFGEMQLDTQTITPTAGTSTTICTLTLSPGKYILFGTVSDLNNNENYLDILIAGTNYTGKQNTYSNANGTKRVNVSSFVNVEEGQKIVKLNVYSSYAHSVTGEMVAIKIAN